MFRAFCKALEDFYLYGQLLVQCFPDEAFGRPFGLGDTRSVEPRFKCHAAFVGALGPERVGSGGFRGSEGPWPKATDDDYGDVTDESPVEGVYNPQMQGDVPRCISETCLSGVESDVCWPLSMGRRCSGTRISGTCWLTYKRCSSLVCLPGGPLDDSNRC